MISGYDAVAGLLADARLSVDKRYSGGGYSGFSLPPALDRNLLNLDGVEHGRLRRLAAPTFSRRSADSLRKVVQRISAATFRTLDENASGAVDLLDQLCVPVPALVIGELLGVPADRYGQLRDAATAMVTFDASSKESAVRLAEAVEWMAGTFTSVVRAKRDEPGDDLISGWVRAGDDADLLSEDELISLAFLMMLAGLENVVHLCGNIFAALLATGVPADWKDRRGQLMEAANPLPFAIRRFTVSDLTIGDRIIPKGDTVLLSVFGADSDPARNGRPSLMFGRGSHYCLGAQVSDLIVDAVVPELFVRYPRVRLAVPESELEHRASWRSHGLVALPVLLRGPGEFGKNARHERNG
ncbi:cytochrome P450 [Nocardia pseudovaccinii]|uniref:cytochrome P450 n=1 Tax=Nocardia pseudovaccinii TaxID=189540 RepID=UPI003D8B937F